MTTNYKQAEQMRFVYIILATVIGGMLTSYWLASLCIALILYIAWMQYKLHQLNQWLLSKDPKATPDSDGMWGNITLQIHSLQKRYDKRKKHLNRLLKRHQSIIAGLPYATIALNNKNEIDWANKQSNNLLGINIKIDRGQRIDNLIRLPKVQKTLDKNSNKEIEITSPRDHSRKLALQLIPIQSDLKLLIARDISERVHTQQMRKNFISNASHELRTPLTVIAGYLEIIQSNPNLPEQLNKAVITASEQALRMQRIIEDLLTLSRLENSDLNGESNKIVDMPSILTSICNDEVKLLSEHSQHSLHTDISAELTIRGAKSEIISVCSNLIHNAIRHTPKGTSIHVTWNKQLNGEARLTVKDNGDGIPAKHLTHLTERFYRVDKGRSQNKGGTGLGLAIVQHILQRHNGRLEIQSSVGKGATFLVFFPADRVV